MLIKTAHTGKWSITAVMARKYLTVLLLVPAIWSCRNNDSDRGKEGSEEGSPELGWSMPFILDTFGFRTNTLYRDEPGVANYYPLYFGPVKDTLEVNYSMRVYPSPSPIRVYTDSNGKDSIETPSDRHRDYPEPEEVETYEPYFLINSSVNFTRADTAGVEVHVDTAQTIRNIDYASFQESTFAFWAYPVLITNNTGKTVQVGYGRHLKLILEARDQYGNWRPLERSFLYACGTGVADIVLPPDQCVLTSVKIFRGEFQTELRLNLEGHYSESFHGSINLSQLRKSD